MQQQIEIGQRFGQLTAIKKLDRKWNSYFVWECLCDCGRKITSSVYYLLKGKSKSCGINGHMVNLIGQKFGKLLVVEKAENKNKFSAWKCKCDCGKDFIAETRGLIHNRTKSCGCDKRPHLEGKKFGHLTVKKEMPKRSSSRGIKWECLCDCGNYVYPETTRLINKKATSCGRCTRKDLTGKKFGSLTVIKCLKLIGTSSNYSWLCECDCGKEISVQGGLLTSGGTRSCGCLRIIYKNRTLIAQKRIYQSYKMSAKRKNLEFNLPFDDFIRLISQNCYYCDSPPSNKKEEGKITKMSCTYSGIDRKDNTKGYTTENCVPCCKICNFAKTDMTINEFIQRIQKLGKNLRLKGYG